jgi:hypothetical protein
MLHKYEALNEVNEKELPPLYGAVPFFRFIDNVDGLRMGGWADGLS